MICLYVTQYEFDQCNLKEDNFLVQLTFWIIETARALISGDIIDKDKNDNDYQNGEEGSKGIDFSD